MWLIEFITGNLNGVTLPIECSLCLTGADETNTSDVLTLPEYWSKDTFLKLELDGDELYVQGFYRNEKRVRLVRNRVYQFNGLAFFVFIKGQRAPKLHRYRFKQYQFVLVFGLVLNTILTTAGIVWWQEHQGELIASYWKQIGSGYIKGDHLYVYDPKVVDSLPEYLTSNITVVKSAKYSRTSQLSVEVVSSDTGEPVSSSIIPEKGRDQIRVQTQELDNKVMSLLGKAGISFVKEGKIWHVSNIELAERVLKTHRLDSILKYLQPRNDSYELVNADDFPYAIFFSTRSGRYIYDANNRYWEGSLVPGLGVLKSITREKVIFGDGRKTRIYHIPKQ